MTRSTLIERLATQRPIVAGLVIATATIVAYLPARQAGFVWDDQYYITENLLMGSVDGLMRAWFVLGSAQQYYPMIHTSFWLEYWLWGMEPGGYHVTNVLFHAANALLLWRVLVRLSLPGAWLAAAIFALHPVEVETAAWIAERKNLLSTFFYLLAMLAYFRFEQPDRERTHGADPRWYWTAFGLFLAALLSKTVAFSLPAAIALIFWWKRGRLSWRSLRPLTGFLVVGVAFGALTAWMEKNVVGATGPGWDFTPLDRILIAGRAVWFYLGKLLWPASLSFSYPRWTIDASQAWQYLFPLAAATVLVLTWALRDRIGRGPLTAWLFFGGTLFPALGFFDVFPFKFSFVADHFQYLASIGPIALFAAVATLGIRRLRWPAVGDASSVAVLALLAVLTWNQSALYQSRIGLWADVISKNPNSTLAHNNIATLYAEQGDYQLAVRHNREALRIDPDYELNHLNLGINLAHLRRNAEAMRHFRIQIERFDDQYCGHDRLAALLVRQGRLGEALDNYRAALQHGPPDKRIEARIRTLERRLSR